LQRKKKVMEQTKEFGVIPPKPEPVVEKKEEEEPCAPPRPLTRQKQMTQMIFQK